MNLLEIKNLEPCIHRWENLIRHYPEWEGTPLDFLKLEHISVEDKQWLFLREEYVPKRELHLYACFCAESVLHIFEKEYPDDKRPREAIEAKRLWLDGKISDDALASASDSARASVLDLDSASDSARASVSDWDSDWDSARGRASASALASVRASVRASARTWALASALVSASASASASENQLVELKRILLKIY